MAESTYLGACKLHVHCENYTLKEGEPIKFFGCDEIYDEAEWVDMKNCSGIIHPTTFSLVPNTNYVSMDKCCIEKCSPRTLASLEKLSSLDIRNSKFPIDDDTFQDCKNINSLSLADLEFTDASNKWSHLSSIDTISFSTCKFESLSKNFLRGLNSIKYLSISDCKIAKTWGEEKDPLVLCSHGLMDNAGSFDRLIPHLPSSFYYVAIDLPGHGRSSHFPPHLPIHSLNFLLVYKHITKHFGRKFIALGHSYGGQLGLLYAHLYPECVEKIVMLESIILFPISARHLKDFLANRLTEYVNLEEKLSKRQAPTYTREDALDRLRNRNDVVMSLEAAEALLTRAVEEVDGRFRFTLDQRQKCFLNPTVDFRYAVESLKSHPIRCPVLIILARDFPDHRNYMKPAIQLLKTWKNVQVQMVRGNHDVHNDFPERVVPYINEFLVKEKAKL